MAEKKRLTFFEAASTVAGYGVGGGIMTVPYLASFSGIIPFIGILIVGYFVSVLLHLMIVEMMLRDDESSQMVEVLGKYLFRGRGGIFFTWLFFVLIIFGFYASLLAYISGGGEILMEILFIPERIGQIIFYLLAAGVVFFGLKAVGVSEKYGIITIFVVVSALAVITLANPFELDIAKMGDVKEGMALFGMVMFSFAAFFSVPQAVEGLSWNKKLAPKAVVVGIGITLVFILTITLLAMGASGGSTAEVTSIAILGWGKALGFWPLYLGSLFILFAMLTSFWAISLALAVVLKERLNWSDRISWLFATLPCLVIALLKLTTFLGYIALAGGIIGVLIAILMIPAYLATRKHGVVKKPAWTMGVWGKGIFLIIVVLGYILMAVGSALSPAFD
jgi:amino acid permease